MESFQILLIPNLFENYGCSGSDGRLRTIKPIGKPSDEVDKAIRSRIHCIKCAQEFYNIRYSKYAFNEESRNCCKSLLRVLIFQVFFRFDNYNLIKKYPSKWDSHTSENFLRMRLEIFCTDRLCWHFGFKLW